MIDADIFIPSSNRIDSLKTCLDSLDRQTNKNFHIIIAKIRENKAVDHLLKKYPRLSIYSFVQVKRGLIGAANESLGKSRYPIFIRVDDDVEMKPFWFDSLIKTYRADKTIGGVTGPTIMSKDGLNSRHLTKFIGEIQSNDNMLFRVIKGYLKIIYEDKMYEPSMFLKSGAFTLGSNYPKALKIKHLIDVDNLEACNWSCRRNLLLKIGGFDESYTKGLGEFHEADAARKINCLGYRLIFNPQVQLKHNVEQGKVQDARGESFWRIQNFVLFYFRFNRIKNFD